MKESMTLKPILKSSLDAIATFYPRGGKASNEMQGAVTDKMAAEHTETYPHLDGILDFQYSVLGLV